MTENVLAAIVHSTDAAIIGKTLDGVVTSWNVAAERIFGYSAAEMIGKPIEIIASPSRPNEMSEILGRVRRGERVERFETERRRKNGEIVDVLLTVSPILDRRGKIIGASKVAHDITAQKNTETRLGELSQALGLAPIMLRGLDGTIQLWGGGLERLYGYTAAEAAGKSVQDLLRTRFPIPLDELQAELMKAGRWEGECVRIHRDGHRMIVSVQWTLFRGVTGPGSVVEIDLDLTEERRSQTMLEEREARLRSVLETAPDAVITIDERGIIQSFSQAAEKLFAYNAGEVIGHNVKMLMPQPYQREHDGHLSRYRRTSEKHIIGIGRKVEAQRKDGTVFPMELSVGEVGEPGQNRIFTGFIRDLSAREKIEEDLRQAQKMEAVGQLTGGLAHDFNNLLTAISGNLEMLEPRLAEADDRELLKEAQEATELGAQLARRLLAFGRRTPLRPQSVDLNAIVLSMADFLRRTLGEAVKLETVLKTGLPQTMADPGQVENVLLNLAINARDAMPKGGRFIIETRHTELDAAYAAEHSEVSPGNYVMLAVTDTGTGMTEEVKRRAFEPFYTTKGPGAGSGLGLSMVHGFVKQSGGHVQIYSELGHGTTVRIYLPIHGDASPKSDAPAPPAAAHPRHREVILAVEDDPRVRRVSLRRLKDLGYTVLEADNGAAAMAIIERGEHFDLLFTDIVMAGGMSGIELAQKAREKRPDLKVLFTSGYAEPAVMTQALFAENAAWLGKPYSTPQLDEKLRALLDA
ncbi:MAG TPA: PAS domain S-box protein [Stellaceae bacterium]|nr:PAS domain S-box protein [Stellaceae bacterium]